MMAIEAEMLTVEQVGDLLGLSKSAVWKLLQQGENPRSRDRWPVPACPSVRAGSTLRAWRENRCSGGEVNERRRRGGVGGHSSARLRTKYEGEFAGCPLSRTWCSEFAPASGTPSRYTTVCSRECAATNCGRRSTAILGWPLDWELMVSPIYDPFGDCEYWIRLSLGNPPVQAMIHGIESDPESMQTRWKLKHDRGPLRELLALEHPVLRRLAQGQQRDIGQDPVSRSGSRSGSRFGSSSGSGSSAITEQAESVGSEERADLNEITLS